MSLLDWAGNLLRRKPKAKIERMVLASLGLDTLIMHNASTRLCRNFQPGTQISFHMPGREMFRVTAAGHLEFTEDMATPEGKVKARVKAMLDAFAPDVWYTFPLTGGFGNSGTPDILACCWGHFLAVECKAGDNTVTALQQREIDSINAAGGAAIVINERNLETLALQLAAWNPHHD